MGKIYSQYRRCPKPRRGGEGKSRVVFHCPLTLKNWSVSCFDQRPTRRLGSLLSATVVSWLLVTSPSSWILAPFLFPLVACCCFFFSCFARISKYREWEYVCSRKSLLAHSKQQHNLST